MKYTWKVTHTYDGRDEDLIGLHDVLIKLDKKIKIHCDDAKEFYEKTLKDKKYKTYQFDLYFFNEIPFNETFFNRIHIVGIFPKYDTNTIVKDVIGLLKEIKTNDKLEEKRLFIKKIKSQKGGGFIK